MAENTETQDTGSGFRAMFEAAFDAEDSGNESTDTPETSDTGTIQGSQASLSSPSEKGAENSVAATDEGAGADSENDFTPSFEIDTSNPQFKAFLEKHPEEGEVLLKTLHEAAFTKAKAVWQPKLQEAAEVRKTIDGIQAKDIETLRQLYAMTPADRAKVYADWAKVAAGEVSEPDLYDTSSELDDFIPTTDGEAYLYAKLKEREELDKQRAQKEALYDTMYAEQSAQKIAEEADRAFKDISSRVGREISPDERLKIEQFILGNEALTTAFAEGKLSTARLVEYGYKLYKYEDDLKVAEQRGIDKMSQRDERLSKSAPPTSTVNNRAPVSSEPTSFREMFEQTGERLGWN